MTSLNVSNNQLCGHWMTPDFSGFKALISAIEQHELLTVEAVDMGESLDVSGQKIGADGAKRMATFIKNNGALGKVTISGDISDSKPVTIETSLTEASFSGKNLGASGAIMLAAFLPKCE